ncbi:hypothetical protein [Roseateles sp. P5_E11]
MIKRPCLLPWSCARQRFAGLVSLPADLMARGSAEDGTCRSAVVTGDHR